MNAVFQYMKDMALGMLAGLPLTAGIRLFCGVRRKRRDGRTTLPHEILALLLGMYLLGLLSQTILPELAAVLESGVYRGSGRINLIPFVIFRQTAIEVFRYGHVSYFLVNFVGNILIFLPLGLLPPLLWKKMERLWKVVLLGCGVSVCIELTQLLLPRGTDIDDVWLNTLGAALGYGVFAILRGAAPNLLPRCRTAPAAERNCNG